jgi:hypothetical protein
MSVVRLSNDDRCAVDLILERDGTGSDGISNCFTAAPSTEMQARLTRVEKILHLLDASTPVEPASDLVARTLARCDQQVQIDRAMPVPAQPGTSTVVR